MFHNHLPSLVWNLDIDNSGGQVPAHGESLPSSFPGIVRIYFYTSVFVVFMLLKYVHMYGLLLMWSLHPFNDVLYFGIADSCSFRFLCSVKDNWSWLLSFMMLDIR